MAQIVGEMKQTVTTGETAINKTIVITYDDASRMVDFCKDANDDVSKEFYDWYLKEPGEYFAKAGMLIIEGLLGEQEKVALSFDFNNPDSVEFNVYRYNDQEIISRFIFSRQDNLTMKEISVQVKYFSPNFFKSQKSLWVSADLKESISSASQALASRIAVRKKTGTRATKTELVCEGQFNNVLKTINVYNCRQLVYFTYALMYYVSKQVPEEITTEFRKQLEVETGGIKVKSIYKYTGYIDLRENKVYRPTVEKDPDEPVRDYQRHIEKWSVRGHYRKTSKGMIWIDPHTKGEGELEKRTYSTEDEKDLNLIPKVFEVQRTVKVNTEIEIIAPEQVTEERMPVESVTVVPVPVESVTVVSAPIEKKELSFLRKLLRFFGW